LGQIDERVVGPLCELISGTLFAIFALLFLSTASARKFGIAVFAYLLLTKLEVLFFPPYGDAIGGPFAEAIWLKHNGLNYAGLLHQPGYAMGGPKVYFFSIYPTYLALTMMLIPNIKLFFVTHHLLVFAMVAVSVSLFREISARAFSAQVAILLSLVLLYMPVIQSQTEAINMEMAYTFFIMISAHALIKKEFGRASLMAMTAVLIKGIGQFSCAAVLLVGVLGWLAGDPEFRRNKKIFLWWLGLLVMMGLALSVKFLIKDQHVSAGMVRLFAGWPSLKIFFISRLYLGALCIVLVALLIEKFAKKITLPQKYDLFVMLIFCTMWFLLFMNFFAVSPRYRISVYPFLIYLVFYALAILIRPGILRQVCLFAVIFAALFYSYGKFEPSTIENDHVILERSLEYRADLKLNQLIVKTVQDKYDKYLVGAPFIIAQLLAVPELGYATKPLHVMIYGFACTYGGIKNFPGIENLDIAHTIYVGVQVSQISPDFYYPVGPQDKVIEHLEYGNKKASLFMGGMAIETLYRGTTLMKLKEMQRKKVP
jgi:hypothetical protein